MPKKTRQEKILAQLKRLQQLQSNQSVQNNKIEKETKTTIKVDLNPVETEKPIVSRNEKKVDFDYSYVTKDLRKSLIFAAAAIIFEIALSILG